MGDAAGGVCADGHRPLTSACNSWLKATAAEFYVDSVTIREQAPIPNLNGDMEADSGWSDVNAPTTQERHPRPTNGRYTYQVSGDTNDGIESPTWALATQVQYALLARVQVVSGTVKFQLLNSANTVLTETTAAGTGDWETLHLAYTPTSVPQTVKIRLVAAADSTAFFADTVVPRLLRWHAFTYDSKGRVLTEQTIDPADGTSVLQEAARAYYSSGDGDGLLETVTQRSVAVQQRANVTFNTGQENQYQINYSGSKPSQWSATGGNPGAQIEGNPYEADVRIDLPAPSKVTYVAASARATNGWLSISLIREGGEVVNVDPSSNSLLTNPTLQWLELSNNALPAHTDVVAVRFVAGAPFNYGALDNCVVAYEPLNTLDDVITTYFYDSVGRVIQVNQSSTFGSCTRSRTVFDDAGNVTLSICNYVEQGASDPADWLWTTATNPEGQWEDGAGNAIDHGSTLDQNIVTSTTYDALGRPVQVRNVLGQVNLTVYDALDSREAHHRQLCRQRRSPGELGLG